MRNHNYLLMVLMAASLTFAASTSYAQWSSSATGTVQDLNGVYMVDANTVIATGNNGTVLRSTNGGATFSQVFTAADDVNEVQFVSSTTGYAVSDNGRFLKTVNAGLTWSVSLIGTSSNVTGLHFRDVNNGHVVGRDGVIFATSNGGTSWTAQASGTSERLEDVYFTSAANGFIAARNDTYLTTTNGGATWTIGSLLGTGRDLNDIQFVDASNGFIATDNGVLLRTTNGGASWTSSFVGTIQNLNEVHFIDGTNGYLAGDGGVILSSTDAGSTWTVEPSGTTANLEDIHFAGTGTGVAVGNGGTAVFMDAAPCTTPATGLNVSISVAANLVTFSWDAYPDAQSYLVEGGPAGGVLRTKSTLTNGFSLGGNSNFSYGTTYNWRVTAMCTGGAIAPPSAFDVFTTPGARVGQFASTVQISPNPAMDFANLNWTSTVEENALINIFDQTGSLVVRKVISAEVGQNSARLNLSTLTPGIYFVRISTSDEVMSQKIVIR